MGNFIQKLIRENFLIIPITSKTYKEVLELYKEINFSFSFSVENGAATFINTDVNKKNYFKKIVHKNAISRKTIKRIIYNNSFKKYSKYISLVEDLNLETQMQISQLNSKGISNFSRRDFSLPIIWKGPEHLIRDFKDDLFNYKLKAIFGGKMYNICGNHNKVDALKYLINYYSRKLRNRSLSIISIGDSKNDVEMLNYAKYSGIVKNSNNFIIKLDKRKNVFYSKLYAPYGWVELIKKIKIKMEKKHS